MAVSRSKGQGTLRVCLSLDLTVEMIEMLEVLKREYGVQTRARAIEILLRDLLSEDG